ncbi:MAG: response regulator transcription factor [Saprospiraceae bacterium]|nr:response regulator transcription factor [Saprospiraceae bacterium]
MTTCLIIEDQPPAQRILETYIAEMDQLQLVGIFNDALSALEFLKAESVDLLFLDIHLPRLSGLDLLKIVHPRPKVIFTTAFRDYALEAFELDVVDYLLKPFSFERFVRAVSKVLYQEKSPEVGDNNSPKLPQDGSYLFVKVGKDYQNIQVSDIHFIKSNGDYTQLFTRQGKLLVSQSLRYWIDKLSDHTFCQIHKSYLVHIPHISKVSGNRVFIGQHELPVGRAYKERLAQFLP